MNSCVFCLEANVPGYARTFLPLEWPYPHRTLHRSADCFVVPGYGPIVCPYVLVIPIRHSLSLSHLQGRERLAIFEALEPLLASGLFPSNSICVFEHGGCRGSAGSCVDHVHLHAVDGLVPVDRWFLEEMPNIQACEFTPTNGIPHTDRYLYAGRYRGGRSIEGYYLQSDHVESQFFRRLIAHRLNLSSWNWRIGMNPEHMRRTAESYWARMGMPTIDSR
jgi:diadenosine tetraphosphate (Ap4A) HIT family hydrolase